MSCTVGILETPEQISDILPEWLAFLETQPLGASVYNHPEYLLAHIRHNPDGLHNQQLAIVVVREQEKIVCIAPLSIHDQKFRLELSVKRLFPIRIRQMKCPGNSFIFVNTQNVFDYFDAVFETLHRSNIRFDMLTIWGLRNNSPFWDYCTTQLMGKPYRLFNILTEPQCDHRIHLPDSIESLLATVGTKWRRSVRYNLKSFHQSVKDFHLERISDASLVDVCFDIITKISANSWQGKTFGVPNWTTVTWLKCWKEIANSGLLRSYILWADNKPVAYLLACEYNGTLYGQTFGYDLHFTKLAPGIVCLYYCLDDIMTYQPVRMFDFDFGTHVYKRTFANEEIESAVVFVSGSTKGTILAFLQRFLNRFVFRTKKLLQKWNLTNRIRKILKRK